MKRFALALLGLLLAAPAYATIVSSEIVSDSPQADGRRWVTERHVDHVGAVHVVSPAYLNQYDVADPPPAASGNFLPLLSLAPDRTWEGVDHNPRHSPFAILGAIAP